MLTVSVYDSVFEITAYPGHLDGALDHPASMMYFAELARSFNLPLAVTEQGANSYHHTEDGQRYLIMRGALAAASFDIESHSHLLWNDEPGFEGVHEQFYGIARDQHQQSKPSGHEVARVGWLTRHADTSARRRAPQVMIVVPRESMDVGLEGWTSDALAGPWMHVSGLTTSSLLAERGLPSSVRVVVFAGRHAVGTAAMLERVRGMEAVIYADAAQFGIDDQELRMKILKEVTGLSRRPVNVCLEATEVEWPGHDTANLTVSHMRLGEALDIRRKDLPSGATVFSSVRGTDQVLAYRYQNTVISALPFGRPVDSIDADHTLWTRTLLGRALQDRLDLPFHIIEGADLSYNLIGDTLTVVNGHDSMKTARLSFDGGINIASIDVASGQFSAVQLSNHPSLAVLSGQGRVMMNDNVVLENDAHITSMLAGGELRVEQLHGRDGVYITAVEANGIALSMQYEHGIDVWTGAAAGNSAIIRTRAKQVVESSARFRSRMAVRPAPEETDGPGRASYFTSRAVEDRALRHTLLAAPSAAWIEWKAQANQSTPLQCEYSWWSGTGATRGSSVHELERQSGRLSLPLPSEFPALIRCVLTSAVGNEATADLVYEAEDTLDTLTTRTGENILRTRLMHPMRREGFDVTDARATLFEDQGERAARLLIGHRGMHTRHLQWSEDWVDSYG